MEKWADFLISAARYERTAEGIKISHLKVHKDEGNKITGGLTWTKDQVLTEILKGKSFFTIFRDDKGNWQKGRQITFKQENGGYIISDNREMFSDLLNDLPEL